MNELVKVYGFRRSGNNLLCALLKYNFYPGIHLDSKIDPIPSKLCVYPDGHTERKTPWGGLFGSHDIFPGSLTPHQRERAIYIKRELLETVASYRAFMRSLGTEVRDIDKLVESIVRHHEAWKNIYTVRYEDLVDDPVSVLKTIGLTFNLRRVPDEWVLIPRKIGWNPRGD